MNHLSPMFSRQAFTQKTRLDQAVDARADQYSFCVSLWEGLHGQRPQEAETRTQGALLERSSAAPTSRRRVPGWLTDAVARGFATAPEGRWPTMSALLDRLERGLERLRRMAIVAAGLAVAAIVTVLLAARRTPEDPCGAMRDLDANWNPLTRAWLEGSLRAAAPEVAADTLARAIPALDSYARRLGNATLNTCRVTRVDRRQSDRLMGLRMACLTERQFALRTTIAVLASADRRLALRAVAEVDALPEIESCSGAESMLDVPLLSEAQRARVAVLVQRLDASRVQFLRGEYGPYLEEALRMADEARAIGYGPVTVRALRVLGQAMDAAGRDSSAVAQELAKVAAGAHDDVALAQAWADVIFGMSSFGGDPKAARALMPVLAAAIERAGGGPQLKYRGAMSEGFVAAMEGRPRDGAAAFEEASRLAVSARERCDALRNVGAALIAAADRPAALAAMEATARCVADGYGTSHPMAGEALANLAPLQFDLGRVDDADASIAMARSVLERSVGEVDPMMLTLYTAEAHVAEARGEKDRVLALRRRVADVDAASGARTRWTCKNLFTLGNALAEAGKLDEAERAFGEALTGYKEVLGSSSFEYAQVESHFAMYLASNGRCREAMPMLEHSRDALAGHLELVVALDSLAACVFEDGRREEAFALGEQALAICAQGGCPPNVAPSLMINLGELLIASGPKTRARGIALLRNASAVFQRLGNVDMVAYVDRVLRQGAPK